MVQVAVAASVAEAEEIQTILSAAGIPSQLVPAVEHHPAGLEDVPQKMLVDPEKDARSRAGRDRGHDRARRDLGEM